MISKERISKIEDIHKDYNVKKSKVAPGSSRAAPSSVWSLSQTRFLLEGKKPSSPFFPFPFLIHLASCRPNLPSLPPYTLHLLSPLTCRHLWRPFSLRRTPPALNDTRNLTLGVVSERAVRQRDSALLQDTTALFAF